MSSYIHGTDPVEQARLSKLNDLINSRCIRQLTIRPGDRILDMGSGLGQFTLLMAQRTGPTGVCTGIERDSNQLNRAAQLVSSANCPWIQFRPGNVESLELPPSEWGTYNLAHARFILEHVQHPDQLVSSMCRAVQAGGQVVLADDDHAHLCLYPEPAGFAPLWQAYIRSYDRLGNDPFIGRRLVSLLYEAGLRNIRNEVIFFGDSGESETFTAYARNLIGILEGARPLMLREKLIDESTFETGIQNLLTWSARPDASLWYTINWAVGIKP